MKHSGVVTTGQYVFAPIVIHPAPVGVVVSQYSIELNVKHAGVGVGVVVGQYHCVPIWIHPVPPVVD